MSHGKDQGASYRFRTPTTATRQSKFGSNCWMFKSIKVGRMVRVFGNLQYYNVLSAEMDPDVLYYCENPDISTVWDIGSLPSSPAVDLWLQRRDGREEYQIIKYSETLKGYDALSQQETGGIRFNVLTEKEIIPGRYYVQNLSFLYGRVCRLGAGYKDPATESVLRFLTTETSCTCRDISDVLGIPVAKVLDILAVLHYNGKIHLNLTAAPICYETEVN